MTTREPSVRWSDFSTVGRCAIIAGAAVELGLLVASLRDLRRRPAGLVRGRKGVWTAVCFVNTIGPLTYFIVGRKKKP